MRITRRVLKSLSALWLALSIGFLVFGASPSSAQEEETTDAAEEVDAQAAADAALIQEGSGVYDAVCQACHQPGGAGLEGSFPPLKGNDHARDAEYVREVVVGGSEGAIDVAGVTYDGVMPSFSTLSDDDIDAVVAFVANDLVVSETAAAADEVALPTGPVAGTSLPGFTDLTAYLAFGLFLVLALAVNAPRLLGQGDRLAMSGLDVALKTALIVVGVMLLVVFIPNWAMQSSAVAKMPRFAQDAIGTGLWSAGLGAVLFGLWWAHRDSRI